MINRTAHVRVILNLPSNKKDMEPFAVLLAAVIKIADKLHSMKLPSQVRIGKYIKIPNGLKFIDI